MSTRPPLATAKRLVAPSYTRSPPGTARSTLPARVPSRVILLTRLPPPVVTRTRKPPSGSEVMARGSPRSESADGAFVPAKVTTESAPAADRTARLSLCREKVALTPPGTVATTLYDESTSVVVCADTNAVRPVC